MICPQNCAKRERRKKRLNFQLAIYINNLSQWQLSGKIIRICRQTKMKTEEISKQIKTATRSHRSMWRTSRRMLHKKPSSDKFLLFITRQMEVYRVRIVNWERKRKNAKKQHPFIFPETAVTRLGRKARALFHCFSHVYSWNSQRNSNEIEKLLCDRQMQFSSVCFCSTQNRLQFERMTEANVT